MKCCTYANLQMTVMFLPVWFCRKLNHVGVLYIRYDHSNASSHYRLRLNETKVKNYQNRTFSQIRNYTSTNTIVDGMFRVFHLSGYINIREPVSTKCVYFRNIVVCDRRPSCLTSLSAMYANFLINDWEMTKRSYYNYMFK